MDKWNSRTRRDWRLCHRILGRRKSDYSVVEEGCGACAPQLRCTDPAAKERKQWKSFTSASVIQGGQRAGPRDRRVFLHYCGARVSFAPYVRNREQWSCVLASAAANGKKGRECLGQMSWICRILIARTHLQTRLQKSCSSYTAIAARNHACMTTISASHSSRS